MQAEGRAPLTGDPPDPQERTERERGAAFDPPADPGDPRTDARTDDARDDDARTDEAAEAPVAAPRSHRHRRVGLLLAVAVLVVALDQLTKALVVAQLADREPLRLLGGLLTLTYTRNAGAAFSLGTGFTLLFTAVAVTVVIVILRVSRRLYSIGWAVALGALLGGAIGNLVDRLTRSPGVGRGHVVDWIQLPHFAVFNLADAAITCSAVAMVLLSATGHDVDGTRHRHVDG